MRTKLTELLGINAPIICGGMMRVGTADLAAAVSNAGGLGVMTALTQKTADGLETEIARCQSMTDKPFGVNLTVGVVSTAIDYDEYVDVIIKSGVKIVETAGRSPAPFMERFKAAGIKVIHKCVAVRHALSAEKLGVDVVSIDGFECAGHPGDKDIGGLVLFPAAARVLDIPVVASGGIADGKGLAAALALGCDGVNMGTRFLATQEAPIHDGIKDKIVAMDENQTQVIFRTFNNTVRVFRNSVSEKVAAVEAAGGTYNDIRELVSGANQEIAWQTGDIEAGMVSAGLSGALVEQVLTCQELIDSIVAEAKSIITGRLNGMFAEA